MTWRFAPDLPPDTPEIWQTCDGFHPDITGVYRTGWILSTGTAVSPNTEFHTGRWVTDTTGTSERIAITSGSSAPLTASQVFAGSTDRTGASTPRPTYNEGIAAYGNIVLISSATSGNIASRTIGAAANFADVASTPGADILLVNPQNIVIGLKTDAGGDGWATSDVGDYTNWTTLEAASGNLRQTSGPITAGVILGNDVIAFKNRGVYRGRYVGGVVKWQWELIHAEYGAWGPGCAVAAGDRVYFIGDHGAMLFDGAQFQRIDDGIRNSLEVYLSTNGFSGDYQHSRMIYDKPTQLIFLFRQGQVYFSGSGGRVGSNAGDFYTFNISSGLWGYQSEVQNNSSDAYTAIIDGQTQSLFNGAWSPITSVSFWNATDNEFASLGTAINATDVTTYQPTIGTGKIGARTGHTRVSRVIPRWTYSNGQGSNLSTATLKTCKAYAYNSILQVKADVSPTSTTLSGNQYWADYQKDSQFHQFDFLVNAGACIDGVEIETASAGKY